MDDNILINPRTGQEYEDVPPTVAAKFLDVAPTYIREGLKQGTLPIGSAVQGKGGRWSYNIPVGRLKMYKSGLDISHLADYLKSCIAAV